MCHCVRMAQDDLIGTAEAARLLGKSHRTIHRHVRDGGLTPAHIAPGGAAGIFLFHRSDVEALAAQRDRARGQKAGAA